MPHSDSRLAFIPFSIADDDDERSSMHVKKSQNEQNTDERNLRRDALMEVVVVLELLLDETSL